MLRFLLAFSFYSLSLFLKVIPEIFVLKGISYMCSAIISLFGLSYFFVILGYFWTFSKLLQSLSISFQGYRLYLGHTSRWPELPVALEKPSPVPASQYPHEQTPQHRGNIPHSSTRCSFLRKEGKDSGHCLSQTTKWLDVKFLSQETAMPAA